VELYIMEYHSRIIPYCLHHPG